LAATVTAIGTTALLMGSVEFYDNGSTTPLNPGGTNVVTDEASFTFQPSVGSQQRQGHFQPGLDRCHWQYF
jgi:hypothetical protein